MMDVISEKALSNPRFVKLLEEAQRGFDSNCKLTLAENAMGGTYFLTNPHGKKVLVCKPADEEHNSLNNPHMYSRERGRSWESYKGRITPGFG